MGQPITFKDTFKKSRQLSNKPAQTETFLQYMRKIQQSCITELCFTYSYVAGNKRKRQHNSTQLRYVSHIPMWYNTKLLSQI